MCKLTYLTERPERIVKLADIQANRDKVRYEYSSKIVSGIRELYQRRANYTGTLISGRTGSISIEHVIKSKMAYTKPLHFCTYDTISKLANTLVKFDITSAEDAMDISFFMTNIDTLWIKTINKKFTKEERDNIRLGYIFNKYYLNLERSYNSVVGRILSASSVRYMGGYSTAFAESLNYDDHRLIDELRQILAINLHTLYDILNKRKYTNKEIQNMLIDSIFFNLFFLRLYYNNFASAGAAGMPKLDYDFIGRFYKKYIDTDIKERYLIKLFNNGNMGMIFDSKFLLNLEVAMENYKYLNGIYSNVKQDILSKAKWRHDELLIGLLFNSGNGIYKVKTHTENGMVTSETNIVIFTNEILNKRISQLDLGINNMYSAIFGMKFVPQNLESIRPTDVYNYRTITWIREILYNPNSLFTKEYLYLLYYDNEINELPLLDRRKQIISITLSLAIVFNTKESVLNFLRKYKKINNNNSIYEDIYDNFVISYSGLLSQDNFKNIRILLSNYPEFIIYNFDVLREIDPYKLKTKEEILNKITELYNKKYGGMDMDLVKYGVKYNLSEDELDDYHDLLKKVRNKKPKTIVPLHSVELNDYKLAPLEKGDPYGMFIGLETNCCQHLHSTAAKCVRHGMLKKRSIFYVWYRNNKLIAQSWVWYNEEFDVMVFDSIEATRKTNLVMVAELLQRLSKEMVDKGMVSEVRIGKTNYGITKTVRDVLDTKRVPSIELPKYSGYMDAHEQVLIYRNEEDIVKESEQ